MYLLTGGFGFLGSHVAALLSAQGISFGVVDNCSRAAINESYVRALPFHRMSWVGDVRDARTLESAIGMMEARGSTVRAVLHLAAESHVDESIERPMEAISSNALGTASVAGFCVAHKLPLVYVSTDEVYGDVELDVANEKGCDEDFPLNPSSPYAAGKAAGELFIRASARTYGLRAIILRGSNAFGQRQFGEKLIPLAVSRIKAGLRVDLHGDGSQVRQWIHAEEFAEAILRAGDASLSARRLSRFPGDVPTYNVAGAARMSVLDLVVKLGNASGRTLICGPSKDRPGQDMSYHVRGERAREELGFIASRRVDSPRELDLLLSAYGPAAGAAAV